MTADPNNIKLFVGQVPQTWTEADLKPVMEVFGQISDMVILTDKVSGKSKGCAFITYASRDSAVLAQKELHDQKTLPGMNHPMQVKPSERPGTGGVAPSPVSQQEERRLFVGMLNKDLNEDNVRSLFLPYGSVDDVSVLRNDEGRSKGAAFVRMTNKAEALQAITALHHSQTMPGCTSPLVVKIADTEREKNAKRALAAQGNMGALGAIPQLQLAPLQEVAAYYQQLLQMQSGQQTTPTSLAMVGAASVGQTVTPSPVGASPVVNNSFGLGGGAASMSGFAPQGYAHNKHRVQGHSKQREGPEGCNLFIYHLPNDVTDPDLFQMFTTFGTVISAKVFIDRATNLSKCFGFVSFDNPVSAQTAIQTMNGFQMGTKRLKVQIKKKQDGRPY